MKVQRLQNQIHRLRDKFEQNNIWTRFCKSVRPQIVCLGEDIVRPLGKPREEKIKSFSPTLIKGGVTIVNLIANEIVSVQPMTGLI